jgi:hypothetical protein
MSRRSPHWLAPLLGGILLGLLLVGCGSSTTGGTPPAATATATPRPSPTPSGQGGFKKYSKYNHATFLALEPITDKMRSGHRL